MPEHLDKHETTRQLNRSHGSFELVFAPVILGLLGLWLDRTLDTAPLFLIGALVGVPAPRKIYCTYRYEMAARRAGAASDTPRARVPAATAARAERLARPVEARPRPAGRSDASTSARTAVGVQTCAHEHRPDERPRRGPSPAIGVAFDLAKRSLWLIPVVVIVSAAFWGLDGVVSTMYGLAIVVVNFLLSAYLLAVTGRISAALMAGAALFGFLLRLGLIFLAVMLVRDRRGSSSSRSASR